ncbi:MAG: Gfo/Idh/MocA family oxidoreductase [Parcubacteria group bacterium]|jgi:predicted dehydrogenase
MKKGKILLVGAGGQMGGYYMNALLNDLGIPPCQIVAVDIDPDKIAKFREKYPDVTIISNLDEEVDIHEGFLAVKPASGIKTAIVTTYTPSHHLVIVDLIKRGVENIFTEKPLALDSDKVAYIRANMKPNTKIYTAFLINFSGGVKFVEDFMIKEELYLSEAFVNWGKDRTGDNRPTPGDLEDESVHGIGVVHILSRINQTVKNIRIMANLSYLDYVDPIVQAKAHGMDESFPLPADVNSSSFISETIETNRGTILAGTRSSYVNIQQVRQMNLILSGIASGKPEYLIEINFDTKEGDVLLVKKTGAKEIAIHAFAGNKKITEETHAFLKVVAGQAQDPRLTDFAAAETAVVVSDAVKKSHRTNTMVTVV